MGVLAVDFQFVRLNNDEWSALVRLEDDFVPDGEFDSAVTARLVRLGFAKRLIFESKSNGPTTMFQITEPGHDYFMYQSGVKEKRRSDFIKYLITTAIAVAAFIKSFFG